MIQTYQMFNGGVDMDPSHFFKLASEATTRGHPYKVRKPAESNRVRRSAFAIRVVNDWNGLPAEVVCSSTVNTFKARLDAHWALHRYFLPDTD